MEELVYHFSSSAHLPWILESGELRPGSNKIGGLPLDFLWATTNPRGSRTSSAMVGAWKDAWRRGSTRAVRFTLPTEAFTTLPDTLQRFPQWTNEHVTALKGSASRFGDSDIEGWRCRAKPLPIGPEIQIDTRAYDGDWRPLEGRQAISFGDMRGVVIDGVVYLSKSSITESGAAAYTLAEPMPYAAFVEASGAVLEVARADISLPAKQQ